MRSIITRQSELYMSNQNIHAPRAGLVARGGADTLDISNPAEGSGRGKIEVL